jgi:hypothetical protein
VRKIEWSEVPGNQTNKRQAAVLCFPAGKFVPDECHGSFARLLNMFI